MSMTPRERMLKAFHFDHPDRLPVFYHPSTAGLYIHGQKLLDLFRAYPPDNAVTFDEIPAPPATAFDPDGSYHEFKTDEWGTTWEYRIFGIAGQPCRFPFDDWSGLATFRFPPVPEIDAAEIARQKETHLTWAPLNLSVFERVHEMRPMEKLLVDLLEDDPNLLRFMDDLMDWHRRGIARALAAGAEVFFMGDDWGTQQSLIVSPALFRSFFKPRIADLLRPIREAGRIIMYHSCGTVAPLFDDLVELGINGFWHQIGLYDAETFARRAAANKVLLFLHMDRQYLIPRGTPAEIRAAVKRYAEIHKALGGGAVFYVEIENDAPFENVKALIEAIHEYR